jgi:acyl-CoA dehydrogenase
MLYGKPVIDMPHIGSAVAQAYAHLTAMKLYAYRALDYLRIASADDQRYLLFNAVQKAKVSTTGVKVMALLSECVGAKGFETDTYFEMALRDVQLIPSLEGSTHINLSLTAQFVPLYFNKPDPNLDEPQSAAAGECVSAENPYLMEARSSPSNTIAFPSFLKAYQPLLTIPNVHHFAHQAKAFRLFVKGRSFHPRTADTQAALAVAQCMATIAYGQLVAENCVKFNIPRQMVSAMFHLLVNDLSISALTLASSNRLSAVSRILIRRLVTVPKTTDADWNFVLNRAKTLGVLQSPAV